MAVRKTKAGANLKRWFKEKWKDEKGNPCGSSKIRRLKSVDLLNVLVRKHLEHGVLYLNHKRLKLLLKKKKWEWAVELALSEKGKKKSKKK